MFFTKTGVFIAWALVVLGGTTAALGFLVAFGGDPDQGRGVFGGRTSGSAINNGLRYLFIGVAIGIATEISKSVAGHQISINVDREQMRSEE